MKKWFHIVWKKKNIRYCLIGLFMVLIFFLYNFLIIPFVGILNSPDETSNYFYTIHFIKESIWTLEMPLNSEVGNIIHPRSIFVLGDKLIPGSFLGLPFLYGILGKMFGSFFVLFFTSIFTIIAAFCFYKIISFFFEKRVAIISFFLFLLHPAIWYYSARSMMHNMLFIDLLVIGLCLLLVYHHKWYAWLFSGVFLSLSVATRTSEIIWIGIAAMLLFLFTYKKVTIRYLIIFIVFFVLTFIPILQSYHSIYGKYCFSSYTCQQSVTQIGSITQEPIEEVVVLEQESVPEISFWEKELVSIDSQLRMIFPFGIVLKKVFTQVWRYGIWIMWYLMVPACLGFVLFLKQEKKKKWFLGYMSIASFVSLFLFIYYGSWEFVDNINYWEITLGNSFVRYFLPFYIFCIPFIAYFLIALKKHSKWIFSFLLGLMLFLNFSVIIWGNTEGMIGMYTSITEHKQKQEQVLNIVPEDAIIITERQDKVFFPKRMVIYDFYESEFVAQQVQSLLEYKQVYYFTYRPLGDILHMNESYLSKLSYNIDEHSMISVYDQYLYELKSL